MSSLIDRVAIVAEYTSAEMQKRLKTGTGDEAYNALLMIVNSAPAVDAVEVVRCKDCKHFDPRQGYEYIDGFCKLSDIVTRGKRADGYCDMGERKDDE